MALRDAVTLIRSEEFRDVVHVAAYTSMQTLESDAAAVDEDEAPAVTAHRQVVLSFALRAVTQDDPAFLTSVVRAVATSPAVLESFDGTDVETIPDDAILQALSDAWSTFAKSATVGAPNQQTSTGGIDVTGVGPMSPSNEWPTPVPQDEDDDTSG